MKIYIQCIQSSTQNLACAHRHLCHSSSLISHRHLCHSSSLIWPHGLSWLKTGGLTHVFQVEQWPGFLFLTSNTHLPLLLLFLVVLIISFGYRCYTQRFLLSSDLIFMCCMLSERAKAQYFIKNWSVSTAFPPPAWYPLPLSKTDQCLQHSHHLPGTPFPPTLTPSYPLKATLLFTCFAVDKRPVSISPEHIRGSQQHVVTHQQTRWCVPWHMDRLAERHYASPWCIS